jgi:hypothetical protein
MKLCSSAVLLAALLMTSGSAKAQAPKPGGCGATPVQMDNPHFLTVSRVVLAAKFPSGWELYEKKQNPFFLLHHGDQYATARTVMYIRVQALDGSFEEAVRRDENDFRKDSPEVKIVGELQPEILEKGCLVKTQGFSTSRERHLPWIASPKSQSASCFSMSCSLPTAMPKSSVTRGITSICSKTSAV